MSDLESENKPHMRPMMNNETIGLNPSQQKLLARWALLKAMVIEAANRKRTPFYSESERAGLKPPSPFLPVGTSVWIGRLSNKAFHAGGTEIWRPEDEIPKAVHGCVTTIVVGHLVIQIFTAHVLPRFANRALDIECNPGAWDVNLLCIWPIFGALQWPPHLSFDMTRGQNSIRRLIDKWKMGTDLGR